ncbi:hypothetical protein DUI87_08535 [Hirundo rustica rustica]|uniref:Integrase-type domain-containing protein n=1 Tax=Hirundo rustica rustica TaxID=333673 RepID=A0A3M0KSP7_HIRRU|nr:hypothetical protein DUI87_08535 [Hirundo rustica rustica]
MGTGKELKELKGWNPNKALIPPHPEKEPTLPFAIDGSLFSQRTRTAGTQTCGLKPQGAPRLEEPHVEHVAEEPHAGTSAFQQKSPDLIVKDPATRETKSPHDLVTWGRGYTYVSTPPGLKWVPAKWVKPFIPKSAKPPAEAPQVAITTWRRRKSQTHS